MTTTIKEMEQRIGAKIGTYNVWLRKNRKKDFQILQREHNKMIENCLRELAKTIDNKCVPLPNSDSFSK